MSTREKMRQGAEQYGAGQSSDFFKFDKSGDFKIRVITDPVAIATHFFGKGVPSSVCYGAEKGCPYHKEDKDKPSVKFLAYIIDRADGKIKIGELPWSVVSAIADFEEDEDFRFDEYPMPYDIKVKYDKENKDKKSIYKTIASPKREDITAEEKAGVEEKNKKQTIESLVSGRKEKQLKKHKEDGTWDKEFELRKKNVAEAKVGESEPIEYPEEEINPDDIPF